MLLLRFSGREVGNPISRLDFHIRIMVEFEVATEWTKTLHFYCRKLCTLTAPFMEKLTAMPDNEYVHPLIEHSWGQRAVCLFDPDHHIIEVAENLNMVIKRFLDSGMTFENTAKRMDVPVKYIRSQII